MLTSQRLWLYQQAWPCFRARAGKPARRDIAAHALPSRTGEQPGYRTYDGDLGVSSAKRLGRLRGPAGLIGANSATATQTQQARGNVFPTLTQALAASVFWSIAEYAIGGGRVYPSRLSHSRDGAGGRATGVRVAY